VGPLCPQSLPTAGDRCAVKAVVVSEAATGIETVGLRLGLARHQERLPE
jgi:hypothetical protein